jgi:hypothetical protein
MNVIEFVRFVAYLILAGAFLRLIEMKWGGQTGLRGDIAEGLGVVY